MHKTRILALALTIGTIGGGAFGVSSALANHQFTDVATGNAFHDDIDWVTDNGIAAGYPDGTFRPTAPINRQQASRWFRQYNQGLHVVTASVNPAPGTTFEVTADCPEGERALMGSGAVTDGFDLTLADSYANETFQWLVRYDGPGNVTVDPTQIQVSVLCGPGL